MKLRDIYDVPEDVANGAHSPAFAKFLWNWFGDTRALTHGELDITFLRDLTSEDLSLAQQLIRRNLRLNQNHIIEGVSALHDVDAVPVLQRMLAEEPDISRRLTIAGTLWKVSRDPAFVACLEEAKSKSITVFATPHLWQVLWLDDERAIDFLMDLLETGEWSVQSLTLGLLNELEFGCRMGVPAAKMPHQRADYRKLRTDPVFRCHMTAAIHKRNLESKNGW